MSRAIEWGVVRSHPVVYAPNHLPKLARTERYLFKYWTPEPNPPKKHRQIDRIYLHTAAHPTWTMEEVRDYHTRPADQGGRGYNDVAYHRGIERDGAVKYGRPDNVMPAAQAGYNTGSMAVVLLGHGDQQEPTDEQWYAMVRVLAEMCVQYGLDPMQAVKGHREVNQGKTCPGKLVDMDRVRSDVAQLLDLLASTH